MLLKRPRLKLLAVVLVLAIAAVPALPSYLRGNWPWQPPLAMPNLARLRALPQTGLMLPGWNLQDQQAIEVSGKTWLSQTMTAIDSQQSPQSILLLLRPPTWERDQPQVEWMDVNGLQQWTVDSRQRLEFAVPNVEQAIAARFLRGWSEQQTYAVLQWYAWPTGGSSTSIRWFWADQQQQWQTHQRLPWVAVCVLMPIAPLGEIEAVKPTAIAIGRAVQTALLMTALNGTD